MKIYQNANFSLRARAAMVISILIILGGILSACTANTSSKSGSSEAALGASLPAEMQKAPTIVQESYQFALSNPDDLKNVPCYCGCGAVGHSSNYDCYIKEIKTSGEIIFDEHALGCSICVDISQDVIKMTKDGKSRVEIRTTIDQTYSQYGSSNMPPAE